MLAETGVTGVRELVVEGPKPEKPDRRLTLLGLPVTWIPTTWVFNRGGLLATAFNYGEVSREQLAGAVEGAREHGRRVSPHGPPPRHRGGGSRRREGESPRRPAASHSPPASRRCTPAAGHERRQRALAQRAVGADARAHVEPERADHGTAWATLPGRSPPARKTGTCELLADRRLTRASRGRGPSRPAS